VAQVAAWLLIAGLASTGLTNAKTDDGTETDDYSYLEGDAWFNLPQNARWYVAPTEEADNQPPVTVSYDCGALLDRCMRDEKVPRDGARTMIRSLLMLSYFGPVENQERETSDKCRKLACEWQEDQLVCHGPQNVVTSTSNRLNAWCNHGLQQISCEVQHIESPIDVLNKLGIPGGEIVSAEGKELEPAALTTDFIFRRRQTDSPFDVRAATSIQWQYPIYLKALDGAAVQRLRTFVQGVPRANLRYSPKVTVFQGQQAFIQEVIWRPFVVGLRSTGDEDPTPQIKIVPEGSTFSLVAIADAQTGRVRLHINIADSRIIDVTTATAVTRPDGKPLSVQVPSVENRSYNVAADLASGESLLLHPLEETAKHRRSYILITARIVTPVD
jgi:hypothetical protein